MNCVLCLSKNTITHLKKNDPQFGIRIYNKCKNCHLIFLSPQYHLDAKSEKSRYDLHQNDPKDLNYISFLNRLAEPLKLKIREDCSGLDFGCGPGPAMTKLFDENTYKINFYDPFYYPDHSLLNKTYDFITCTEAVEHFYNPNKEFSLLNNLLKKQFSYLGIMTEMVTDESNFENWWYHRDPTHVCFYSKQTFEWIAQWQNWSLEFPRKNVVIFLKGFNRHT